MMILVGVFMQFFGTKVLNRKGKRRIKERDDHLQDNDNGLSMQWSKRIRIALFSILSQTESRKEH